VSSTYYDQEIGKGLYDEMISGEFSRRAESDFWITDFQIGYRLPKRWGSVNLNVFNLSDEKFSGYRSSLEESVVPARTVTLSVGFTSH
jgi:hypothetical protein